MTILPFFIIIPLAGAFLSALLGRRVKLSSDAAAVLSCAALVLLSFNVIKLAGAHKFLAYNLGGWMPPLGLSLALDGLSSLILVAVNLVSLMAAVYAVSYMRIYTEKWKFFSLFLLMLAGMNGVVLSSDMFNLYVFLEVASISGYALVAFGTEPEDLEAAFKYAVMGSLASIFILLGIALLYGYTSTLNMADISVALSSRPRGTLVGFVSVLFLAGFGLKAALVPFHAWLPDAHSSAPSPVSAVLSGVFIKTLGIYAMMRVFFNVLGISDKVLLILMVLGVLSMVAGALLAIIQNDIKRMFAYSSISQVGYIIFALGIGTPLALLGGLFHLFNHAMFKSLLFLDAGAIEYSTGKRSLEKLGGLSSKLKVTGFTSLIGSMSISGIPPLAGFWSKLIIIIAALQSGYFGFASIAVIVSIITLAYYTKFQTFAFYGKLDEAYSYIKEAALSMKVSMLALSLICIAGGLLLLPSMRPFLQSAADVLSNGSGYAGAFFGAVK
ncbi:MAG: proton-conducting transporter membrane subunit [Candidatus Omnitrophica bacterium]|nr:proton-conducting transporter membrane subunit [Candidatus Omnitrophota bacterium]MDD5655209.1 proton-conducting transporter membrane subunit [Candidatus Omnitrophota bacterium]